MLRLLVFLCCTLRLLNLRSTGAALTLSTYYCDNSTTFQPNSTYNTNLQLVFSSLVSNVDSKTGYSNASADQVFGSFLCKADVTAADCRECVVAATQMITKLCPGDMTAILWYDQCMLRYSNRSFFSVMEEEPYLRKVNEENVGDADPFMKHLMSAMDKLISKVLENYAVATRKFAAGAKKFATKETITIYGFAQCSPDISETDCGKCLKKAKSLISDCCAGKIGGKVLLPSCFVRFEKYIFYNIISKENARSVSTLVIILASAAVATVLFTIGCCFLAKKIAEKYRDAIEEQIVALGIEYSSIEALHLDLDTIKAATNNFSDDKKLGEGGFGAVYKGRLPCGQEIAAKRLSRKSGQGAEEFKNEIESVARLQHRNLVRLLGLCFEGEERILIYEFVPNRSLDHFLFDAGKKEQLDWPKRYKIITGIARGLLYLHEDSRLRIVHRDLKASNVLLDGDMNPKISDFGTARICGVDETEGSTKRIIGTYGYMSPEYVNYGNYSVKSDVFSFGVLVLEIISGQKNSSSYQSGTGEGLLDKSWKYWKNGLASELMDPILKESCSMDEVIRCIHIALLCVEEDMEDRPTVASIVLMLNSDTVSLPLPQQPAFINYIRRHPNTPRSTNLNQLSTFSVSTF